MSTPTALPPMANMDNRIVLPLDYTREAARQLCLLACQGGAHIRPCLVPLIAERDALMVRQPEVLGISPDCQVGGVKCQACTGCTHDCHRPSGGTFTGPSAPMTRFRTPS